MHQCPAFDPGGHTTIKYGCNVKGIRFFLRHSIGKWVLQCANCDMHEKGVIAERGGGENNTMQQ